MKTTRFDVTRGACLAVLALILAGCMSQEPEEGDRDLVLKAEDLLPYGIDLPRGYATWETLKREKWIDSSFAVEYEFEPPEDAELPYLYSLTERHTSKSDACNSYSAGNIGLPFGLGDNELDVRDDLYSYGDESRFGLLTAEGQPFGNYFAMCKGRAAVMIVLGGLYFDDGEMWAELIQPMLGEVAILE